MPANSQEEGQNEPDVLVVGAGLAGLSCALELTRAGREVLVLERRGWLGGRTASWEQDGMQVESALHRFLGLYSALPDLLEKAGTSADDALTWSDAIEIRLPDGGPTGVYHLSPTDKPFRSLMSVLGNSDFLPLESKSAVLRLFSTGLADYYRRPEWLDKRSIREYARKRRVPETVIRRLVEPLSTGLLFLPPERYSAYVFFASLGPFLGRIWKMGLGSFQAPMGESMIRPIARAIENGGGEIRTNAPVGSLLTAEAKTPTGRSGRSRNREFQSGQFRSGQPRGKSVRGVRLESGEEIEAQETVLATSIRDAKALLQEPFSEHPALEGLWALPTMPAATIQLELSEPALPTDRTTFAPGTVLCSFAEQSRTTFQHLPGRLSVILSPPEAFLHKSREETFEATCREAERIGLSLREKTTRYRVVAEPDLFYSVSPGTQRLRPPQDVPIEGLALAGDYTAQVYPPTMEAAVVSGKRVAEAVSS